MGQSPGRMVAHPEAIQMGLSGSVPESRLGSGQLPGLPAIQAESPERGVSAQAIDDENTASFSLFLAEGPGIKKELTARNQAVFERHEHCRAGDSDGLGKFHIIGQHRLVLGAELRVHFDALDEVDEWLDSCKNRLLPGQFFHR